MIPIYRGSDFDNFTTCPFNYGSNLLRRACKAHEDPADIRRFLEDYCCPQGTDYILEHCGSAPVPLQNRITQIGTQFHRFASAYGQHLKRAGVDSDLDVAALISSIHAAATVDGEPIPHLRDTMMFWASLWQHDPAAMPQADDLDLATGSFERGHEVHLDVLGKPAIYSFHPDYAKLTNDGERIEIWDWKSGLRAATYDPRKPNTQLLRYAWGFSKLYPTITTASLNLWFVNPDHPLCNEPLNWELDLVQNPISEEIIAGPIMAIRMAPDFAPNAGCWLCQGWCEWAAHCDEADAVAWFLSMDAETARDAWEARKASYALSKQMNHKRSLLLDLVDAYVQQNGPLEIGKDKDGRSLTYGPKKKLVAVVPDKAATVKELVETGHEEQLSHFTLEGAREMAEELGMDAPFDREQPLESVRLKWRVTTAEEGPAEDDAEPQAPKKKRARKTLAQPEQQEREITPPTHDTGMVGAF